MKKYYLLTFSIMIVVLFYAVPAYSGGGPMGCCQIPPASPTPTPEPGCYDDVSEGDCTGEGEVHIANGECYPGEGPAGNCMATGACCVSGSGCSVVTSSSCVNMGGLYQGNDTICDSSTCPTGACCTNPTNTDECVLTDLDDCESVIGGDYIGDSTTCSACALGACCRTTEPGIGQCLSEERLDQCDALPGQWLGTDTECGPTNPCRVPDHQMCYLMYDPLNKVEDVEVKIPKFMVDMQCEDTGATRMFCAPACKTRLDEPPPPSPNPDSVCITTSDISDYICYRFDQCAGDLIDLPDGVFVSDQFGNRVVDGLNEHMLCVPAEKVIAPTPSPVPTPSGTPSPEPTISCVRPPGSLGEGCNNGPGDVCGSNIYVCDGSGGGLPTTKCVKKVNNNRCCVADTSSVGDQCFVTGP